MRRPSAPPAPPAGSCSIVNPPLVDTPAQPAATPPAGAGHRERLREKFISANGLGLADYELLELALTYAIPRRDVKPLAKSLLKQFINLEGVLNAGPDLVTHPGLGPHSAALLRLIGVLSRRITRQTIEKKPVLANRLTHYDYLYTLYADKTREELHVLYLDAHLALITCEMLFLGTLTQSAASPRDILKQSLALNAAGLIVAHNHPSGIPTPSPADISFTQALSVACQSLNLALHDHLIVGHNQIYSFRANNLF